MRQVSLHKQRKVARAGTARKLSILVRLLPATQKIKNGSLRSHPHPPSGYRLPQAGEGLAWADQQAGEPDQYFHPNLR